MIFLFILYLLLALWLAFFYPKTFFTFYILASTKFLGFFDAEALFVFNGLGLGTPGLHLTLVLVLILKAKIKRVPKNYKVFALGMSAFLVYGIFSPVILGYESIFQALMASKGFWCLTFFIYLIRFRNQLPLSYILNVLIFIGTYISITYIVSLLFNLYPPFYYSEEIFRAYYPTYMSLAWFFVYFKLLNKSLKRIHFIFYSILFSTSLFLAGHFALTFSTIFFISLHVLIVQKQKSFSIKTVFRGALALGLISYLVLLTPVLSTNINSIISGDNTAISSRNIYNKHRWVAIYEKPFSGYGFIHKSADITQDYVDNGENRFMERFEVIDSGYVDILIKFGFVGLVLTLLIWVKPVIRILKNQRFYSYLEVVCSLYILQYILVNYTWSVFTFNHGLIPGFVAIFIICYCSERRLILKKNRFSIAKLKKR
jgi:hypothetical protein